MGSIKSAIPSFRQVSETLQVSPPLVALLDELIAVASSSSAAVRQLAVFPGLLEVDVASLRTSTIEALQDSPLIALLPSVQYHVDGKVTHRADGFEGNIDRMVALQIGSHLALCEWLLGRFLAKTLERFEPRTLLDSLAEWPHLAPHRAVLLAIASERFAGGDWVSSGFIVVTLYEAVLRDLLRAGGYSALKVEPGGLQMDETLNSLLRSDAARNVLGAEHCDLVDHVLCEPQLGWNLRNEVAHGTVHAGALTPTRVLLVWLFLIRVTCFVARRPGSHTIDGEGAETLDAKPSVEGAASVELGPVASDRGAGPSTETVGGPGDGDSKDA